MNHIWIGCLIVVAGTVLLRFAGRRSVSQMTFGSLMVMLMLGTIFVGPVTQESPLWTLIVVISMIITLVILEWLQLRFRALERFLSGEAVVVIHNGELNVKNLRRLRLTVSKLEMRLRQHGIKHISDVKMASVEVNGELGYELKPQMEPLTVGEFQRMMKTLIPEMMNAAQQTRNAGTQIWKSQNDSLLADSHQSSSANVFDELRPLEATKPEHRIPETTHD